MAGQKNCRVSLDYEIIHAKDLPGHCFMHYIFCFWHKKNSNMGCQQAPGEFSMGIGVKAIEREFQP
jgi:hypothetical protein